MLAAIAPFLLSQRRNRILPLAPRRVVPPLQSGVPEARRLAGRGVNPLALDQFAKRPPDVHRLRPERTGGGGRGPGRGEGKGGPPPPAAPCSGRGRGPPPAASAPASAR